MPRPKTARGAGPSRWLRAVESLCFLAAGAQGLYAVAIAMAWLDAEDPAETLHRLLFCGAGAFAALWLGSIARKHARRRERIEYERTQMNTRVTNHERDA